MLTIPLLILHLVLPRGPYPQNVTRTSFYVLWETPRRMECTVSVTGEDQETRTARTGPSIDHKVRFDGLTPHTRYGYVVRCGGSEWKGRVVTAPDPSMPFSFLVYGDNRWENRQHTAVVRAMAGQRGDFLINTGDLVHDGRVLKYWYTFFSIEEPLIATIPLYPAPGNHENTGSDKGLANWRRFFELPRNGPAEELIYYFDWGNSRFFVLDCNRTFTASSQGMWLKAMLEETAMIPTIEHIFVIVHQSPYTSGPHGPNLDLLKSGLVDEMRRYGVDILFAGHDHIYERGRADGLNYVISGGGGAPIYYVRHKIPYSIVTEPTLHYIRVDVDGPTVSLAAYRLDGSLMDFMVLRKKTEGGIRVEVIKEKRPASPAPDATPSAEATATQVSVPNRSSRNDSRNTWHIWVLMLLAFVAAGGYLLYSRYR